MNEENKSLPPDATDKEIFVSVDMFMRIMQNQPLNVIISTGVSYLNSVNTVLSPQEQAGLIKILDEFVVNLKTQYANNIEVVTDAEVKPTLQ